MAKNRPLSGILRGEIWPFLLDCLHLLGKSVELLANSIAEMRTYGEGFIIADQSPGLLDMSVIRNTNTKIILRLPDFSDRELVGRAAGLDDRQIVELGRLEKGAAVITQSDWLEPVLCKVDKYESVGWTKPKAQQPAPAPNEITAEKALLDFIMNKEIYRRSDRVDIQRLWEKLVRSRLDTAVKRDFIEYLNAEDEKEGKALRGLVYDFLGVEKVIEQSEKCTDAEERLHWVTALLRPSLAGYTRRQITRVVALIVWEQAERDSSYKELAQKYLKVYWRNGGII